MDLRLFSISQRFSLGLVACVRVAFARGIGEKVDIRFFSTGQRSEGFWKGGIKISH